jgi:hypothetical protein
VVLLKNRLQFSPLFAVQFIQFGAIFVGIDSTDDERENCGSDPTFVVIIMGTSDYVDSKNLCPIS